MQPEIQRFCWFDTVQPGATNWKYKRAIEGHKIILVDVEFVIEWTDSDVYAQIYEGHTYSHWGSFPNIFDQATLRLANVRGYTTSLLFPLNNYGVKEFTMSMRSTESVNAKRYCIIVNFYEVPMTKAETFEYAVKQPRYKIRHGSARTLDRFED